MVTQHWYHSDPTQHKFLTILFSKFTEGSTSSTNKDYSEF